MRADFRARVLAVVVELLDAVEARSADAPYSQRDGERPTGCGREKFMKAHRRGRRAGDSGCWAEGKALLMTRDAWGRLSRAPQARPPLALVKQASADGVDDALLAEFGARRAGGSR